MDIPKGLFSLYISLCRIVVNCYTDHVDDAQSSRGERDGVGWGRHGEHEGEGSGDSDRQHQVERVLSQVDSLWKHIKGCISNI